jgi:hypothetical protein
MECVWQLTAWIDVLNLSAPASVSLADVPNYRLQLEAYIERCAMVLEDWGQRDAQTLGDFHWGWVDYNYQLAYLSMELEGYVDLRLFVWVNDLAFASIQTIHVLAVTKNGENYLQGEGLELLLRRRDDAIAQLLLWES